MKACVLMDVVGCIDVVLEGNGQKEGEGGRSESHKEGEGKRRESPMPCIIVCYWKCHSLMNQFDMRRGSFIVYGCRYNILAVGLVGCSVEEERREKEGGAPWLIVMEGAPSSLC